MSRRPEHQWPKKGERISIRPKLFIGLGGTGSKLCDSVKHRIQNNKEQLATSRFVVLDTNEDDLSNLKHLHPDEKLNLGNLELEDLSTIGHKKSDANNDVSKHELLDALSTTSIGERVLGRKCFLLKEALLRQHFQRIVKHLTTEVFEGFTSDTYSLKRDVQVYIFSSLTGGTGSGILFDVVYLLKLFFKNRLQRASFIGYLLLPNSCLLPRQGNRFVNSLPFFMANTYAALKEIEYLSNPDTFFTENLTFTSIDSSDPPFNACYLIGSYTNIHPSDFFDLMSYYLALSIQSQLFQIKVKRILDEIRQNSMDQSELKNQCYSSLCLCSLELPIQLIKEFVTHRMLDSFLVYIFQPYSHAGVLTLEDHCRKFLEDPGFYYRAGSNKVVRNYLEKKYSTLFHSFDDLLLQFKRASIDPTKTYGQLNRYIKRFSLSCNKIFDEILYYDFRDEMHFFQNKLYSLFNHLSQKSGSLYIVGDLLKELKNLLSRKQIKLSEIIDAEFLSTGRSKNTLDSAMNKLVNENKSLFNVFKGKTIVQNLLDPLEVYFQERISDLTIQFEIMWIKSAISKIEETQAVFQAQKDLFSEHRHKIRKNLKLLEFKLKEINNRHDCFGNLILSEDLEKMVKWFNSEIDDTVFQMLQFSNPSIMENSLTSASLLGQNEAKNTRDSNSAFDVIREVQIDLIKKVCLSSTNNHDHAIEKLATWCGQKVEGSQVFEIHEIMKICNKTSTLTNIISKMPNLNVWFDDLKMKDIKFRLNFLSTTYSFLSDFIEKNLTKNQKVYKNFNGLISAEWELEDPSKVFSISEFHGFALHRSAAVKRYKEAYHSLKNDIPLHSQKEWTTLFSDPRYDLFPIRQREFQTIPNPYVVGRPIVSPEIFFGREDLFGFVKNNLIGPQGDNILILQGRRRSGKSSFLYQLRSRNTLSPNIVAYFDMQNLKPIVTASSRDKGTAVFLKKLAMGVQKEFVKNNNKTTIQLSAFEWNDNPFWAFDNYLDELELQLNGKHIVLLIDEFEGIEDLVNEKCLNPDIFQYFRSLMQHRTFLNFILTGAHGLEEMRKDYWSILFSIALFQKISFLEYTNSHRLVTKPIEGFLEYDQDAIALLHRLSGGQPYFLQAGCKIIVNRMNEQKRLYVTTKDVEEIQDLWLEQTEATLLRYWDELPHTQCKQFLGILAYLILGSSNYLHLKHAFSFTEKINVTFNENEIDNSLRSLCNRFEILETHPENPGELRFRFDIFRYWLRRNPPKELYEFLRKIGTVPDLRQPQ